MVHTIERGNPHGFSFFLSFLLSFSLCFLLVNGDLLPATAVMMMRMMMMVIGSLVMMDLI